MKETNTTIVIDFGVDIRCWRWRGIIDHSRRCRWCQCRCRCWCRCIWIAICASHCSLRRSVRIVFPQFKTSSNIEEKNNKTMITQSDECVRRRVRRVERIVARTSSGTADTKHGNGKWELVTTVFHKSHEPELTISAEWHRRSARARHDIAPETHATLCKAAIDDVASRSPSLVNPIYSFVCFKTWTEKNNWLLVLFAIDVVSCAYYHRRHHHLRRHRHLRHLRRCYRHRPHCTITNFQAIRRLRSLHLHFQKVMI